MSKEYKLYLIQLRQSHLSQSVFTSKLLFYIKTCSFYFYSYLFSRVNNFPYSADEMMRYLYEDYLEIIHIHSHSVESWSKELFSCITQLMSLVHGSCWYDREKKVQMKILFPTGKIICDYVKDLMRIMSHKPFYKQTKPNRSNDETILMQSIFAFLFMAVQTYDINWVFRSNTTMRDIVVSVVEATLNDKVALGGYGILGEILTDDEFKDLKIAGNMSRFFFNMLEDAWNQPTKKYKHLPITSLLRGLQTLSKNDSIQESTAHLNKMNLLIEMCDEYPIVYDIIWAFSFNQDIQEQLRSNLSFISKLTQLSKECDNEQMSKMIHGILWNLETNHENRPTSKIKDEKKFDIMISYSHKEKDLCKQIYEELSKAGYRIWIDFDQMHGNVMDAMAQGIEQSHIIIVCMSEHYRKSNYCRAEAHYAFQQQRKIVPLILQKQYKPDGWLSFLIGHLLYVDFNQYEFSQAMKMLFKELKVEHICETNAVPIRPKADAAVRFPTLSVSSPKRSASPTFSQNILQWTQKQVQDWLLEHNLVQMSRLLMNHDGRSLIYLSQYMKNCQPQQILNSLQQDSLRRINESISLIELSYFHSLIDQQKSSTKKKKPQH
ncbi:unnamed protein product [Rotaria sordida]|uniref:TIR domain-containing protein n=1 Tax=Rotaria sordida TaxID=392033 RepID=A0A815LKA1_9BILA|nr:unnamed protein product [Rotaria sordida]